MGIDKMHGRENTEERKSEWVKESIGQIVDKSKNVKDEARETAIVFEWLTPFAFI
jgi:hypothetical protein